MSLDRSAFRRARRKGRGFATPGGGMGEQRPQRVAMQGRRDGRHTLFSSLLGEWGWLVVEVADMRHSTISWRDIPLLRHV